MSNTRHEVHTNHGIVHVFGYDVGNYDDVEQWVKDHQAVISTALSAAGVAIAGASYYVTHVRRK